jgi:uncharacterized phage protein gp47/JayE
MVVKTREEWRDYWLKNFSNRNPDADVGPGSYPWLRACVFAEMMTILSGDALAISDTIPLANMTGSQLDAKYGDKLPRNLETNASGYVTVSAGSAGTTITIGSTLSHASTKNSYKVTSITGTYLNGQQVAVESVDPGIGQNLGVGEILQWTSPGPGCYATVVVFQTTDGEGIIGGRSTESDDEYRERIRDYNANPIGHGNEGDVIALIEASRDHGVPVEKGFVYPARLGPGTLSYCFTVKRDNYWESRTPSSAQITAVFDYISGKLPGDFSITPASIGTTDTTVALSLSLDPRYSTWTDFAPWPTYYARAAGMLVIGTVTSVSVFTIVTDNGVYTSVTAPSAGNTIALYDYTLGVFRRKKILTVGGSGPWTITCDMTVGQSDATYLPWTNQAVSPWFDAINSCAEAAGKHMASLGPGEGFAKSSLPEDGTRMARQPKPYPGQFNDELTAQIAYDIQSGVSSVTSCSFLAASETLPGYGSVDTNVILNMVDLSIYKA